MEKIRSKLLDLFGGCANDPEFEELMKLIRAYGSRKLKEGIRLNG